jgi:multiple sugar transport system substrate-binding protein
MKLKGMTWSHERGLHPLLAASEQFRTIEAGIEIEWDARSLADFELYPLELLADTYDFIMIDHPHIGTAVAKELLLPLTGIIDSTFLRNQEEYSTGHSYDSYFFEGLQWALPVDAAAQVSAYRADLLRSAGLTPAIGWEEVFEIARELPKGQKIGVPLVPVHAYSTFFTLCAQFSSRAYWSEGIDLPLEVGEQALELMQRLMSVIHPSSVDCDPIDMLNRMGTTDEIAYVPLIYGYSNYAREGFRTSVVSFTNIPSDTGRPEGSMIGGVGLAISSRCKHPDVAVKFATMVASPNFQRTTFFQHGGQPGHRSAWEDVEVNRRSGGFFEQTLDTLTYGSLRPRFDGYVAFQERAGHLLRNMVMNGTGDRKKAIHELNQLHQLARQGE